ncbi:Chitinase [Purpureocillium takamizusanense]|uniref:chitinase n=1 Tax=Purpureocillium takamizusanense TaxID=2060973 RepID=A0A9Q8V5C3_9HYPO|nr:Chitinase [Purpureocillium takamizusanense]UNI13565.1 Chitinase [Purpureocillium takamizusanense]
MLFAASSLACLGLMATSALAAPFKPAAAITSTRRGAYGGEAQNVLYWGQNGGGTTENEDLAAYCTKAAGVDIVVLSFIYQYGKGQLLPGGAIGQSCTITAGKGQGCDALARAIDTCKSNGVKVILSLGGATGSYSLSSQQEAEAIGQNLWDAYGNSQGSNSSSYPSSSSAASPRPFGKTFVDGFDFDIESNSGNQYYEFMIAKLRSNFASDPSHAYYITGAPQCPTPEPNMNQIITKAQFDYLFVQFYNNPGCSVDGEINWDAWKSNIASGPSAKAKLFLGVPASPLGATGTQNGAKYYLEPAKLAALANKLKADGVFGGIMMWAAGFSDANVNNGCTYAQAAKRILTTGSPC